MATITWQDINGIDIPSGTTVYAGQQYRFKVLSSYNRNYTVNMYIRAADTTVLKTISSIVSVSSTANVTVYSSYFTLQPYVEIGTNTTIEAALRYSGTTEATSTRYTVNLPKTSNITINVGGVNYSNTETYINVGGTWKTGQVYINVGGVWKT
jgi:hypothetical protein